MQKQEILGTTIKDTNQNITGRRSGFSLARWCFSELLPKPVEEKSQTLLSNEGIKILQCHFGILL